MTCTTHSRITVGDYLFIALCFVFGLGCLAVFGGLAFPASEKFDTIFASWIVTGTGLLIFLRQVVRLKTKRLAPICPNGVGAGLIGLGAFMLSSNILMQTYLSFQAPVLHIIGVMLILTGSPLLIFFLVFGKN